MFAGSTTWKRMLGSVALTALDTTAGAIGVLVGMTPFGTFVEHGNEKIG